MEVAEFLRRSPLVFVDDLAHPVVSEHDLRHLTKSLRLPLGAPIAIGDGAGRWAPGLLGEVAELTDETRTVPAPTPPIGVGFAPVKAERPDFVVQKLVELGVDRIIVLETRRSVIRWDGPRGTKQIDRMSRVAAEACMQSKRLYRPVIEGPVSLAGLASDGYQIALAEPGGRPLGHLGPLSTGSLICVGPEGGWSDEELAGHDHVGLPGTILRAETAAIAAGVLLASRRANC